MIAATTSRSLHARCSLAKLHASEMAFRVADRAVQIFGGRGYMRDNVAERFLREVRVDRIWEGTSEIQRLIIARALERRGLEATIGNLTPTRGRHQGREINDMIKDCNSPEGGFD